jgi:amino acid transporter
VGDHNGDMAGDVGLGGEPGLRRGAIGLREGLFQSVTAMAPGAAIAASIPAGAAFAGGALPLSVLVALVPVLATAVCVGALASRMPTANSVATYTAQGLHPALGFLVAWGYLFVETLVPPLLFLQLGFTVAGTLHDEWHSYPAKLWWPWVIAGAVLVAVLGYYGVRASARAGTVLGAFEILVFLVVAVLFVAKAHQTLSVFGTSHTPPDHRGLSGVIAGSVYSLLALAGFESAAPLAEETERPERNIRRAVVGAALGVGVLYVFTTYAATVLYGPDRFQKFGGSGPASWEGLARAEYGVFWVLVFLAIVNSTLANANAGANVSTRTGYALARIRLLPSGFQRLHPTHRSPVWAVAVQFAAGLAVALGLGWHYTPQTAFLLVATVITLVVGSVYVLVDVACVGYFLRRDRAAFNPVTHLLAPAVGVVFFVPALLTAAGIPAFSFVTRLAAPVSYAGAIVATWMGVGALVLAWLLVQRPERVRQVAEVFGAEEGNDG